MSATTDQPPSRRERLRTETTREIKEIAVRQLTTEGPGAISLRGIAREMGMTPRAIYSYFATRDDLVTALIAEVSESLLAALEAARDAIGADDPAGRLLAWCQAMREWAVARPEGFRLIYGDQVPGYQAPADGPLVDISRRICGGLNQLVVAACPPADVSVAADFDWSDFPPAYLAKIQNRVPGLTPATAELTLRAWGRMQGLVTLEIYGHLRAVTNDPAALYRVEILDFVDSLRTFVPRS